MDRLQHLMVARALTLVGLVTLGAACSGDKAPAAAGPPQSGQRSAGVKSVAQQQAAEAAAAGFCEKRFPATGSGSRRFEVPPEQPLAVAGKVPAEPQSPHWTWVNLWATWCSPCMQEMALLGRWRESLAGGGSAFALDLWSIDAAADQSALEARAASGLPGRVRWMRSEADFKALLSNLGLDETAAIPIHALVDPKGMLRCVRVGAIRDVDFAQVKAMLGGA